MVVGFTGMHLAALTVMAQGGPDAYATYSYPALVVLLALLVAWACAGVESRWGTRAATLAAMVTTALTVFVYRPDALAWKPDAVSALWHDRDAAACSWRFAEGFEREYRHGLAAAGTTPEQYAIDRCRSLSDPDQVLDCIGGIARELHWRRGGKVDGEPPAGLDSAERRAYAYHWGTHRVGDLAGCAEFRSPELVDECVAAVRLECLVFADVLSRFAFGRRISGPRCDLPAPPMNAYWASARRDLLARSPGERPELPPGPGDPDMRACEPVLSACYRP
jgi:hypothetical protein